MEGRSMKNQRRHPSVFYLALGAVSMLFAATLCHADAAKLVAAAYSDRYHLPSCKIAQKIAPEDLKTFNTPEEAVAAGFVPCRKCNPPVPKDYRRRRPILEAGKVAIQVRNAGERGHFDTAGSRPIILFLCRISRPGLDGFRALRVINEDRVAAGAGFLRIRTAIWRSSLMFWTVRSRTRTAWATARRYGPAKSSA